MRKIEPKEIAGEIADEVVRRLSGPGAISYSDGCENFESLCRPRFFAGQVLTDDDLNRLDRYIRQKNRLHNRFLHGWGVVCGLKVSCSPCHGMVEVSSGYALSPCGDDILVDRATSLDICALLQHCRVKFRPPCDPSEPESKVEMWQSRQPEVEEWDLMIRYTERPQKGVTPLRNPAGKTCACGGSCGCGGNCGSRSCCGQSTSSQGGSKTLTKSYSVAANAPARCEPTILCEGYQFELCRPERTRKPKDPLTRAFQEGWEKLVEILQPIALAPDSAAIYTAALDARQRLLEDYDCADDWLIQRLRTYLPPSPPGAAGDLDAYRRAVEKGVMRFGMHLLLRSLCVALLPDCPTPTCDDRVGLARLVVTTEQDGTCRIRAICNYAPRRFVMTFPNLGHWLGWTTIFDSIRATILGLCCLPSHYFLQKYQRTEMMAATAVAGDDSMVEDNQADEPRLWSFAGLRGVVPDLGKGRQLFRSAQGRRTRRNEPLSASDILGDAATQQKAGVTEREAANPAAALTMHQLVVPILGDLRVALGSAEANDKEFVEKEWSADAPTRSEVGTLRTEVDTLRQQLDAQSALIEELRRKIG